MMNTAIGKAVIIDKFLQTADVRIRTRIICLVIRTTSLFYASEGICEHMFRCVCVCVCVSKVLVMQLQINSFG